MSTLVPVLFVVALLPVCLTLTAINIPSAHSLSIPQKHYGNLCFADSNKSQSITDLSPYGCVAPVSCPDIMECMRKEPETIPRKDYSDINTAVCIIAIVIASIIIGVLWIILRYVYEYRKRKIMINHHRKMDINLERYINEPYRSLNEDEISNVVPFDSSNAASISNSIASIKKLREFRSPRESDVKNDKSVKWCCRFVSGLTFLIIGFSLFVVIIFPSTPEYHICNNDTDWNEIWSALIHGSAQTNYDILLTVKNDNYFSMELTDISARFYYDKYMIGYWYPCDNTSHTSEYCNVYIPSHSIIDILADVTFIPPISKAYTIYELYQENKLKLEVNLFGNTKTYFLSKEREIKIFDMHLNLDKRDFIIGATLKSDRTDCNCPQYL